MNITKQEEGIGMTAGMAEPVTQTVQVNGSRLLQRLQALAQIGANAQGGIDRQLASAADIEARAWLERCWAQELGLRVRTDAVLNLWGEGGAGLEPDLKPLVIGSHHDTVLRRRCKVCKSRGSSCGIPSGCFRSQVRSRMVSAFRLLARKCYVAA